MPLMKHTPSIAGLLMLTVAGALLADGPDDEYVRIYSLIQQADNLRERGQSAPSAQKYSEVETALKQMRQSYPAWNPRVVEFRLRYVAERLESSNLETKPLEFPTLEKLSAPAPDGLAEQIKLLQGHIRQLEADRELLQAKLMEALSAQPASVDPRELTKAEEKTKSLEKEIELLKVNLQKADARPDKPVDPAILDQTRKALTTAEQKLAQQNGRIATLDLEKQALQNRLQTFLSATEARNLGEENPSLKRQAVELEAIRPALGGIEEVRLQLADLQTELAAQKSRNEVLQAEKKILERRLSELSLPRDPDSTSKIRALEKELADAKSALQSKTVALSALQSELKSAQEANARAEKEKQDMQSKVSGAPAAETGTVRPGKAGSERAKPLEREREATKDLSDKKTGTRLPNDGRLNNQLAVLRARLEVLEARQVPYTEEELALLRMPDVKPATGDQRPAGKSTNALPAGAAPLVAEAERAFAARRLDEAAQKYQQALRFDEGNAVVLANLAAVQIQQNRLGEAESTLKRAMAADPEDAFSLSLMGVVKARLEKHDEAIELLSRAAQLDPKNAETHNYLGITLFEKGLPGPAEAALRRAVQLSPNNAGAHHNLAVVYATQKPPSLGLARWHYQKALNSGHPKNPDLEKTLNGEKSVPQSK
jgi:Tfp pilus assembly protein PilF